MRPSHNIDEGQTFRITTGLKKNSTFDVVFRKQLEDGTLVFRFADKRLPWRCNVEDFFRMWQFEGTVRRLKEDGGEEGFATIRPVAFEPIDPIKDSPTVQAVKRNYQKAVTQHYYVRLIDFLNIKSSVANFRKLVTDKKQVAEHKRLGLYHLGFGGSTLIVLCRECGVKGDRPLELFLDGPRGGDQRSGQWDTIILTAKARMIQRFYSAEAPHETDVMAEFRATVAKEAKKRPLESAGFKRPVYNTLRNWIKGAETAAGLALRQGKQVQNRQIGGIHPIEPTLRPLQCVVLDHTQIDMNVIVYDTKGNIKERILRPYLIVVVDVHTRMVLAARLSLEFPSLHTLYAGLKEALRPKVFTQAIKSGGVYDVSRDCFGKFSRMLVDNGLENIGRSLQMSSRAIGLDVSFAPIKTGEYKAIAERLFGMLNTKLWHLALGGVDTKPSDPKAFDPRTKAEFTLAEAQYILWRFIIEVYHLSEHDALYAQPALMWEDAWATWRRPLIDDMGRIEKVFGRYRRRQLTTSGIQYENQVFHDPSIVSSLLADLLYLAKKRKGHKGEHQSVGVWVEITVFDDDVSHIYVFNPVRQDYVRIPNRDRSAAGSYEDQKDVALAQHLRREEFISQDEVDINYDGVVAIVTGRDEMPSDIHSSSHSIPADKTDRNILAMSAPRKKKKSSSKNGRKAPGRSSPAAAAKKGKSSSKSKTPPTAPPEQIASVEIVEAKENLDNLIALTPPPTPTATENVMDFRERIRAQMRQGGASS